MDRSIHIHIQKYPYPDRKKYMKMDTKFHIRTWIGGIDPETLVISELPLNLFANSIVNNTFANLLCLYAEKGLKDFSRFKSSQFILVA